MAKTKYNVVPAKKQGIVIKGKVYDHITEVEGSSQYLKNLIYQGKIDAVKVQGGYYVERGTKPTVRKYEKYVPRLDKTENK